MNDPSRAYPSKDPDERGALSTNDWFLLIDQFRDSVPSPPMFSFLSHRGPQNPPSLTMEKGTYRIRRIPLVRNPEIISFPSNKHVPHLQDTNALEPTPRTESPARSARFMSQENLPVLVVVFLVFATFACLGTAYYLFTASRWAPVCSRTAVTPEPVANKPHHQDDTLNSIPTPSTHSFVPSFVTSSTSSQPDLT